MITELSSRNMLMSQFNVVALYFGAVPSGCGIYWVALLIFLSRIHAIKYVST